MKIRSTNKAFTLIELLAVILILGIIALIAIPAVSGIVKESKNSAAKASAENYVNATETAVMKKNLVIPFNPTTCEVSKTTLSCDGYEPIEVDIKGDLPESGTITFKNNSVEDYSLVYNNKTVTKDGVDTTSSKKYKVYTNGTPVFFDVTTGKQCTNYEETQSKTGVKSGCMKFYAFNDTKNSDTVNLLLDHNTKSKVNWNSNDGWATDGEQGPLTLLNQLHADTDSWNGTETPTNYSYKNETGTKYNSSMNSVGTGYSYKIDYSGYKARLISADEIAQIISKDGWTSSTGSKFYFKDYDENKSSYTGPKPGEFGWLYDRTYRCINDGCNTNDNDAFAYWTSSAYSLNSLCAWFVGHLGKIDYDGVKYDEYIGLRPVITVSKSKLS